jgi:hypothetical protein
MGMQLYQNKASLNFFNETYYDVVSINTITPTVTYNDRFVIMYSMEKVNRDEKILHNIVNTINWIDSIINL